MTSGVPGFADRLAAYDATARAAASTYLASGSSPYLTEPAREYLDRGGKGLRPALCLATCEAFGGREEDAIPSAAAIERPCAAGESGSGRFIARLSGLRCGAA